LGIGLKVDRPFPEAEQRKAALERYRTELCSKLQRLVACRDFAIAAASYAERLRQSGGVASAVDMILTVIENGKNRTEPCSILAAEARDSHITEMSVMKGGA